MNDTAERQSKSAWRRPPERTVQPPRTGREARRAAGLRGRGAPPPTVREEPRREVPTALPQEGGRAWYRPASYVVFDAVGRPRARRLGRRELSPGERPAWIGRTAGLDERFWLDRALLRVGDLLLVKRMAPSADGWHRAAGEPAPHSTRLVYRRPGGLAGRPVPKDPWLARRKTRHLEDVQTPGVPDR